MTDGGTYTLLIALEDPARITFGAAGEYALDAGVYGYTGSAFGSGGFARIERHRELAAGERDARHWHVDYLLGHGPSEVVDVVRTVGADVECAVADRLRARADPVGRLGASDCGCSTHLVYDADRGRLAEAARDAHAAARRGG